MCRCRSWHGQNGDNRRRGRARRRRHFVVVGVQLPRAPIHAQRVPLLSLNLSATTRRRRRIPHAPGPLADAPSSTAPPGPRSSATQPPRAHPVAHSCAACAFCATGLATHRPPSPPRRARHLAAPLLRPLHGNRIKRPPPHHSFTTPPLPLPQSPSTPATSPEELGLAGIEPSRAALATAPFAHPSPPPIDSFHP